MLSIDELFPRVLPYVPGCSEPLARQAILDSAIAFCETTSILNQTLDAFNTVSGLVSYDLESPNRQMKVARILAVTVDGKEIHGTFSEDVPSLPDREGRPTSFYTTRIDSEFVLNLHPVPDDRYEVIITVALSPIIGATSLENDLVNVWSDAIVEGAIARIAKVPNQPFSSFEVAMLYDQSSARKTALVKAESYQGRIRGGTRVKTRPLVR